MVLERYIETILSGNAPLPLVLCRADIERLVNARFGQRLAYEELPAFADANFRYFCGEKEAMGVKEVRALIPQLHYVSGEGVVRIVVIDRFDLITEESANALLKTLEDGIPGVAFLLQADSFVGLLETVVSRVVCVSAENSRLTVRDADMEFARWVVRLRPDSLGQYVASGWYNRSDSLVFLEAVERVLVEERAGGEIFDRILEAYRGIAATNASPKYLLDGVLMHLARLPRG